MIRKFLYFVSLAVGWVTVINAPVFFSKTSYAEKFLSEEDDVTGVYHCEGDGYQGTVVIQKVGDAYQITWTLGNQRHNGVAIRNGNLLSSSWSPSQGGLPGVVVYSIEKDRKLIGKYTAPGGKGRLENETLTFLREREGINGTRNVLSSNDPGEGAY